MTRFFTSALAVTASIIAFDSFGVAYSKAQDNAPSLAPTTVLQPTTPSLQRLPASPNSAQPKQFPADWFTRPPTSERLRDVQAAMTGQSWQPVVLGIYDGALKSYGVRQEEAAFAWYHVARWADLLEQPQNETGKRWLERYKVSDGRSSRFDVGQIHALPDEPLIKLLKPDTVAWLLGDRAFSEMFFDQLSPYDYLPQVFTTLQRIREADTKRFTTYAQLALAIALVYDTPPPRFWPHAQVTTKALPRKLPDALEAFNFLVDADQRGVTLQKLATLPATDLKFAVDLAASFDELRWAQRTVKFSLAEWGKSYDSVRYETARITAQEYVWPGKTYLLPDICGEGGICVDQAYFATQAGKARGLPTILFFGTGQDGRHAWFGYLMNRGKWVMDVGRYAEQRFVTGLAIDPQTWELMSDHELVFLTEDFRRLPPFRQSRMHEAFATFNLQLNRLPAAAAAARKAVTLERRNATAWAILISANVNEPFAIREALLREAAQALQRYPDITSKLTRDLADSMRARGANSAADFEERSLGRREQTKGRTDLAMTSAVDQMAAVKTKDVTEQLRVYRQILKQYGATGGIGFYDRIAKPFILSLVDQEKKVEATQALAQTRTALAPETDSQLDREMKRLLESISKN